MRTLKKVLALTVVLATVFSLTAFAAFTDADQINESCQDDINLMNALNVMVGDAEGTFRPNGTISRAEAAKMVYVVRNGGVDDKASGWTGMKVFNDVPAGAWYEGYVNYCASLGIIAGVGGNKFNPDGAVTGVELAKMLLVVAGYKPDVQGYTGANWSLNVINDAQQAYMFEGYALAFSASAPRQWAAKLFSNAILKTQTAVYFNGELVNGLSAFGSASTIGQKYFSLQTLTGDLLSTYHASFSGGLRDNKAGSVNVSAINALIRTTNNDGTVTTSYAPRSFAYDVPASLLGQEVTVVYKESGDKSSLDEKDTVYDVYATGTTNMVTVTRDAATIDGTTLKLAGVNGGRAVDYNDKQITAILMDDGYTAVATAKITSKETAKTEFEKIFPEKTSNENVTLILNDDNTIKYAFIENANYAFIKKIDLDKGVFTLKDLEKEIKLKDENNKDLVFGNTDAGKQKLADYVVVPSNLEEGALVKYTVSGKTGDLVYTFEAMSPAASGAMTVRNSDAKATIGGASYSIGYAADKLGFDAMPALNLDETFYVYTDGKYAVYVTNETGATSSKISSKMAYVIKKSAADQTDTWGNPIKQVDVLLADGTRKVFDYADKPSTLTDAQYKTFANVSAGKVFEYVMSGEKICFRTESYTTDAAYRVTALNSLEFSAKNQRFGAYPVDGNSYFFYVNSDDGVYKVVRANELLDSAKMVADAQAATVTVNGIPTVAFGVVNSLGANTGTAVYAFIRSDKYTGVSDNKIVDMVDITLSTGEEVSAVINSGEPVKGAIMKVTPVDNQYKFADPSSDAEKDLTEGDLTAASSTLALVNVSKKGVNVKTTGANAFNITADTQIFYVDEANKKLVDAFDLTTQAVKLSINSDNEVLAMYVTKGAEPTPGKTAIDSVSVTLPTLTNNTTVLSTADVTVGTAGLTKGAVTWKQGGTAVAADAKYDETKEYTVEIAVTVADTHEWGSTPSVTVTGATGTVDKAANKITITVPKKGAVEDTKIDKTINKMTLTAPAKTGAELAKQTAGTLPTGVAAVKADNVTWEIADVKTPDKAVGGKLHTATIVLKAATGYVFDADIAKTDITLTGFTVTTATLSDSNKTLTIKATVTPATVDIGGLTFNAIDKLATTHEFGKSTPEVTLTQKGISVVVKWTNDSDSEQTSGNPTGRTTYKAVVTITAEAGYKFKDGFAGGDVDASAATNYTPGTADVSKVSNGEVKITLSVTTD